MIAVVPTRHTIRSLSHLEPTRRSQHPGNPWAEGGCLSTIAIYCNYHQRPEKSGIGAIRWKLIRLITSAPIAGAVTRPLSLRLWLSRRPVSTPPQSFLPQPPLIREADQPCEPWPPGPPCNAYRRRLSASTPPRHANGHQSKQIEDSMRRALTITATSKNGSRHSDGDTHAVATSDQLDCNCSGAGANN